MTFSTGAPSTGTHSNSTTSTGTTSTGTTSTGTTSTGTASRRSAVALVAGTAAGRRHAERLAAAWPSASVVDAGSVAESLRRAWTAYDALVAFVATGIVVRVLGPLMDDKHTDPAVVVCDEAGRHAVALSGGHAGGANRLAEQVAAVLGGVPVVTTASDVRGLPGLDTLGWPVEGAVAAVGRAILDGEPVHLVADTVWPLPPLPANVLIPDGCLPEPQAGRVEIHGAGAGASDGNGCAPSPPANGPGTAGEGYRILVTDRIVDLDGRTAVLRPPSLVVGVGASRGAPVAELAALVDEALARAGLSPASVRALATADVKAGEPAIVDLARQRGWRLRTFTPAELATADVPTPSEAVRAAVGTPSVAEAAALLAGSAPALPDGRTPAARGVLVVRKTRSRPSPAVPDAAPGPNPTASTAPMASGPMATAAVARHAPRGRLALVGLGPGARDQLTPLAARQLRASSVVVGLDQYVDQIRDLLRPGTRILVTGMGQEEQRARSAVDAARAGQAVALIGSGDSGVYAMASPALEEAEEDIDVVGVPGVTAGLAASSLLGAPLGHDHACISLSDLHTPWPVILRRIRAAAEGDFVVLFYNPRSKGRHWQLGHALGLLAEHRPPGTPVGVVRQAGRPDCSVRLSTLAEFDPATVDMYSLVVVGSSRTRLVAGRMVTPRGYRWRAPNRPGPEDDGSLSPAPGPEDDGGSSPPPGSCGDARTDQP